MAELDEALGALDGQLGDRGVVVGRTVEGRGDDLALHRALHVGDLLGPLVDEHDHEVDLGVVHRDRVGDRLQHHRLARLGRRHDQAALALADRCDEVDDARDEVARRGLEAQTLLRVQRRELAELDAVARLLGVGTVDALDLDERVELLGLLALARLAHGAGDGVALAQAEALDHGQRDVDVVVAGQVAAGAHERVAVEDVEDARDREQDVVRTDLDLALEARADGARCGCGGLPSRGPSKPGAVAVTTPTAAAAATAAVVVEVAVVALAALLAVVALAALLAVVALAVALLTVAPVVLLAVALLAVAAVFCWRSPC